ncbi:MAG TPA: phosphotransferase [Candidatus Acidoferrales bacterium]|nr:phosphotransferase [Candidatus Acidoferrales bacterium]
MKSLPVWHPEIAVDQAGARALISAQFPQLDASRVEAIGFGFDNTAFLVGGAYVFRFPRRAVAVALMEREMAVLPIVAPLVPIAIPVPILAGRPDGTYPWPFAGYELLDGSTASSLNLSDADCERIAAPLGAFLRRLHSGHVRQAVGDALPGDLFGRLDHARRLPLATERIAELESAGILHDVEALLGYMAQHPPAVCSDPCVVHGDMYARHLLLDDGKNVCGVIDWGDAHVGDPALDLAIALTMLPERALPVFLAAYGDVAAATWERATYRAIYHSVLVAHYGYTSGDAEMLRTGVDSLANLRKRS